MQININYLIISIFLIKGILIFDLIPLIGDLLNSQEICHWILQLLKSPEASSI